MMPGPNALAERYVTLWNETDPVLRGKGVHDLYKPDALYVFYRKDPIRGHQAVIDQMTYTQEIYWPMGYEFRAEPNAIGHHNLVRLNWVMVTAGNGEMEMAGQDVLVLGEDGRIQADYQFHL